MIKQLSNINVEKLLEAYNLIEHNIVWTNFGSGRQAGLQFKDDEDIWTSAVGKSKSYDLFYSTINPFFKNTIFEEVINQYNLKRTRLMWMGGKSCYSMHRDQTARLHIPLITNPQCYIVFQKGQVEHLTTGSIFWVDTRLNHTAMNGSDADRLHLVGSVES